MKEIKLVGTSENVERIIRLLDECYICLIDNEVKKEKCKNYKSCKDCLMDFCTIEIVKDKK